MTQVELGGAIRQAPDFLTVAQTAKVLQIGRSTAYDLVSRYRATHGAEGIPSVRVGGQLRIPRVRLEEVSGQPISWPPASRTRERRRPLVEHEGCQD